MITRLLLITVYLTLLIRCSGQQKQNNMNPLLCNPDSGVCELLVAPLAGTVTMTEKNTAPIQVTYLTDPICSSCWGIEPQLRKLKLEYGGFVHIDYRMGGLLPSWDGFNSGGITGPRDVAHHWDDVSKHYDMPIDGDIWLEDPLSSSYPPSIAFRAASLQDEKKATFFLRKIREMVFLEKKNIAKWEHLSEAAQQAGLDTTQLKLDMAGPGKTAFEADLALARNMGVRGFPSIFLKNEKGEQEVIYGSRPYEQFENAVQRLVPNATKTEFPKTEMGLFKLYPTWTVREYAEVSGTDRNTALSFLEKRVSDKLLQVTRTKNGAIYRIQ